MKFRKIGIFLALTLGIVLSNGFAVNASVQQLEVHHIDVGQGEAIYIELPDGTDILIDAGKTGSGDTVVNYLKNQESNIEIDFLIASHPDADHVGGMQSVFKDLKVKNFYYPMDAPSTTKTWTNVLNLAKAEGCNIMDATSNTILNIGDAIIKFIHPNKDYRTDNEDSIVTYLDYKEAEFLFTGDIEENVENDMIAQGGLPNVDFMSVPHHGSNASSTLNFLKAVDPEYAIISVGKNSYGHPTSEVLSRLSSVGASVYRTDLVGNIVIKTDGASATINGITVSISDAKKSHVNRISYFRKEGNGLYIDGYSYVSTVNIPKKTDIIQKLKFVDANTGKQVKTYQISNFYSTAASKDPNHGNGIYNYDYAKFRQTINVDDLPKGEYNIKIYTNAKGNQYDEIIAFHTSIGNFTMTRNGKTYTFERAKVKGVNTLKLTVK